MYLFGIGVQARPGKSIECGAIIQELAAVLTADGHPATGFGALAGAPVGSFLISSVMNELAELGEARAAVAANPEANKLQAALGDLLAGPSQTFLNQVIAISPDYVPKPTLQFVVTSIAPGRMGAALAWSTEMVAYAEQVTGVPFLLAMSSAGAFSDLSFIAQADTLADVEIGNEKLASDPGYISRLDQTADLFLPGATRILAQAIG